jgi:hypothetical protein
MFGNIQGWIISLILATAMSVSLVWSARPLGITPPTHNPTVSVALAPITLPSAAAELVPAHDDCDAGDAYRKAIADYRQNQAAYDEFRTHISLQRISSVPAIESLVKVTHCSSAKIFRNAPADLIDYAVEHPDLEACKTLGNAAIAVGLLFKAQKDFDQSRQYLDGAFSLGNKLFVERLTFEEMGAGLGLMQGAARAMEALAKDKGDTGLADTAGRFLKDTDTAANRWIDCYKLVGGIDENFVGQYTGDIFQIAASDSADPMWRVEAIKHLGHYQYNAITQMDEKQARRVLKRLSANQKLDPRVHTAALAAANLTVEQHRATR